MTDAAPFSSPFTHPRLRLDVHDASRLEWGASIPVKEQEAVPYCMRLELRFPATAFVPHSPWTQLQTFARLDGPERGDEASSIDAVRRRTLAVCDTFARAGRKFARECRLGLAKFRPGVASGNLISALEAVLAELGCLVVDFREQLGTIAECPAEPLRRECKLADEYLSTRYLQTLADAELGLTQLLAGAEPEVQLALEPMRDAIAMRFECEAIHRDAQAYPAMDEGDIEPFLARASTLKKHFQQVLFLEASSYQVAQRAYYWVAAFVALLASTWALGWQIWLTNRSFATAQQLGPSLVMFAAVAGVVYATKDRMKEIGRAWLTGKLHRVYGAERVTHYRAPKERLDGNPIVAKVRESFESGESSEPDPLNPEAANVRIAVVKYHHLGSVLPSPALVRQHGGRIKHVLRYDLSPLFARLDDATRTVAVLDRSTKRLRWVEAVRHYRVEVKLSVQVLGTTHIEEGVLFLTKRGLERFERGAPPRGASIVPVPQLPPEPALENAE